MQAKYSCLVSHHSIYLSCQNCPRLMGPLWCWCLILLYTILLKRGHTSDQNMNAKKKITVVLYFVESHKHLLSHCQCNRSRRFYLLQCNLHSLAPANKIGVWGIYIIHLQKHLQGFFFFHISSPEQVHNPGKTGKRKNIWNYKGISIGIK